MFKVKNFSKQQSSYRNLNKNHVINCWNSSSVSLVILSSVWGTQTLNAQEVDLVAIKDEETKTTRLENSQDNILIVSTPSAESTQQPEILAKTTDETPEQIVVKRFDVVGSSVFSQEELTNAIKSYQNRPLTLPELFQARSAITKLYTDKGYVNSGAYIPPQELNNGTVKIAILEGQLESINITGIKHLNPSYIEKRISAAAGVPVNVDSLLEALQLLRLDPLIANLSAELSAGVRPGTSLLDIEIKEADVFNLSASYNNGRSPSVGTIQRSVGLNYGNLLGFGDKFNFNYTNTKGSNSFDFTYGFPVNAKNGTVRMAVGTNSNDVIEEPFTPLDIESKSRYYELNFRQPIILKPEQEFALGLSFSRQESETSLLNLPFALSRGADDNGETKISAIRFYQEYVNRDETKVFALRSQFSVGVDLFNATINDDQPDSTFFAWRGQSQWVRRLGEDFLFLVRGDVQLAGSSLVPLEQFRIGGVDSVRGYRQDLSLGDSGALASAELRIPIFRISKIDGLVQLTPFVDVGTLWNNDNLEIENSTLPSVGLGLSFSTGDSFNARLDWGIPLTDVKNQSGSLQEDGVYFSLDYNFF
jgi:hemolysin activation/secretion protein